MFIKKYTSQLKEISDLLLKGEAVLFLAAGASVSAGAPLWYGLRDALYEEIFSHNNPTEKELNQWIQGNNPGLTMKQIESVLQAPESIFSIAEQAYGRAYLESFLGQWYMDMKVSKTYEIIRTLCRIGIINTILTTNQDGILDKSLINAVPGINVIYPLQEKTFDDEKKRKVEEVPYAVNIFNLHGSYNKPGSILTGIENIVGNEDKLYKEYGLDLIQGIINKYKVIIVVGYCGLDKDICLMFREFKKIKGKQIYWTQYKKNLVPTAKKMGAKVVRIDGSDEFFTGVYEKMHELQKDYYYFVPLTYENQKQRKSVTVYGSVAAAGEYGVYHNGRMIQYTLNLPCHFEAVPARNWEVKLSYYDPVSKIWKEDNERSNCIKVFLENEFFNTMKTYQIKIKSTFPFKSGLGDPEPAGLTRLLTILGLLNNQEERWKFFRACASDEEIYYSNTSYLRPLASMLPPKTLSLLTRKTLAPDGDYKDENFKNKNLNIELEEFNYKIYNNDGMFVIGYLPRGLTLEGERAQTTGTGEATAEIKEAETKDFVKILADLENRLEESLENEKISNPFGDILMIIRDEYFNKKRCRKSECKIISILKESHMIDGGKISGSGPGGGIVFFRKDTNIYPLNLTGDIYDKAGRYICLLEISKPIKNINQDFRQVSDFFEI